MKLMDAFVRRSASEENGHRRILATVLYWFAGLSAAGVAATSASRNDALILIAVVLALLIMARLLEAAAYQGRLKSGDDLSHTDELTGLPNRRSFLEELGAVLDRPVPRSEFTVVFFIDLDRFKAINDTF